MEFAYSLTCVAAQAVSHRLAGLEKHDSIMPAEQLALPLDARSMIEEKTALLQLQNSIQAYL